MKLKSLVTHTITLSILLMFSVLYAQTQVVATANPNVGNPPYGMIAQMWNATTATIYLDHVEVNGAPVGTFTGTIIFGIGLSNLEQPGCQATTAYQIGGVSVLTPAATDVRVSQQPCTPNGLPYRAPYTGPGNCGGLNYTCTNFMSIKTCYVWTCEADFPASIAIPPNTGVTIYTARYTDPSAFGWTGYSAVNFRWHDHSGCPAQPVNNMFCIQ